jgi:hypothetical protein
MDPGYVSRLLTFLDTEALVHRNATGSVEHVVWPALLRRWAADTAQANHGRATHYFDPRGTSVILERLRNVAQRYAITGAHAAARYAPVVPTTSLILWTPDERAIATALGLSATTETPNVILTEPENDYVFEGACCQEGLVYVTPSQACVDLLMHPGRSSAKGEVLLEWMRANESAWRRPDAIATT